MRTRGRLLLDCHLDAGVAVVTVAGEVSVVVCGLLRSALLRILSDGHRHGLVMNLASVIFIDSAGIGILAESSTRPGQPQTGSGRADPPG
jgi:anti-anti-sigma factor